MLSYLRASAAFMFLLFAGCTHGQARTVAPVPPAPRIEAEVVRSDFIALYGHLRSAHFDLYARARREDYDRLHAAMLGEIDRPETRAEIGRRFQRFVAFGRIAHARIDENYRAFEAYLAGGGRSFPLVLRFRSDRAFIAADHSGLEGIDAGDEVIEIGGRDIRAWLETAVHNISADTDYMAGALLELDLPMLLWLELGAVERLEVTIRKEGGRLAGLSVPMRTREQIRTTAESEPPRLNLATSDRTARILPGDIAYLRPGAFYNSEPGAADPYDNSRFRQFIDQAFARFLEAGADKLIIDLRDNPGGDSSFSDLMVAWFADRPFRFASSFRIKVSPEAIASNDRRLEASGRDPTSISGRFAQLYAGVRPGEIVDFPVRDASPRSGRRFSGEVFVLINRNSYSNAVAVAATIQDYRFGRILGEETSDLATTYGAMETFALPATGLVVGFPKAHIIRPNGDTAARGVVPDIAIETPVVEGPEDPVLERALAIASGG